MLVHKDALIVHEVTTPEQSRYFLNGAMFDKEGRAVATDGHLLVRFASEAIDANAFPAIDGIKDLAVAADVIVARDDLRAALSTISKNGNGVANPQVVAIVPNGTAVTLATVSPNRNVKITTSKVEGSFPAYERVLEAKKPLVAKVYLNPALLETLAKMARQAGARTIVFTLHADGTDVMDQLMFTANCEHGVLDGAIMPMRP